MPVAKAAGDEVISGEQSLQLLLCCHWNRRVPVPLAGAASCPAVPCNADSSQAQCNLPGSRLLLLQAP